MPAPESSLRLALALRLALRQVARAPAAPIYAAVTLALGLGAATAIFSVMKGFDAPLPVPHGERVVQVRVVDPEGGAEDIDADDLVAWRAGSRTMAALGAFRRVDVPVHAAGHRARLTRAAAMTPSAFTVLGLSPRLGSLPTDAAAHDGVVVLSHSLWSGWLDGDPQVLGRAVRVGDEVRTVGAVMPEGFHFPFFESVWTVWQPRPGEGGLDVVGRLVPGASHADAEAELQRLLRRGRAERLGGAPSTARVFVHGFTEERGERSEKTMLAGLLFMVMALVFVSCSNVSNLLLERGVARARALAVHQALGAVPTQVMLQVVFEAALIALAGVVLGVAVAYGIVSFVARMLAGHWGYFWMRVEMAPSALGLALLLGAATAVVSATLPARRIRRVDLAATLQQEARASRGGAKGLGSWLLITAQVAFSCVSVIASVLMGLGLLESRRVVDSFPAEEVVWSTVSLEAERYDDTAARRDFARSLIAALGSDPAIQRAALSSGLPGLRAPAYRIARSGEPLAEGSKPVLTSGVTPEFFEMFSLSVQAGRLFGAADSDDVAVVSEGFVRRHLDGEEAIAQRLDLHRGEAPARSVRIIGVVADQRIYARDRARDLEHVYLPLREGDARLLYLIVQPAGERRGAVAAVARAARATDPEVPVGDPKTLTAMLAYVRRFLETLGTLAILGGFGAILVVAIGLYGLVSFDVRRRIPEFALRLALGAPVGSVFGGIVRKGLLLVVPGVVVGLGLTYWMTPLLGIFLGGADSHDPRVFGGALAVYVLVACAAAAIPARRAAFCNPADVLRDE